MGSQGIDLWPKDITEVSIVPPVKILRQQASIIGQRTKGLLEGEVIAETQGSQFVYKFILVAPALDNYRYQLFWIQHGISMYPVTAYPPGSPQGTNLPDEAALVAWLSRILGSDQTKNIVRGILAQVQER